MRRCFVEDDLMIVVVVVMVEYGRGRPMAIDIRII